MTRRSRFGLSAVLVAVLFAAAWLERRSEARSAVPLEVDEVRVLEQQRDAARSALLACEPAEESARRRAVAAAALALARHPDVDPGRARRALLEAATCSRSAGDGTARELFLELANGPAGDERDRARLELAHRARRESELEAALAGYEALLLDPRTAPSRRDDAAWWWARTHELAGHVPAAERGWRRLVLSAGNPCMRVRAWDRLARSRLCRGDHEGARSALVECDRTIARFAEQSSPQGAAVRATAAAMVVRRWLDAPEHGAGPSEKTRAVSK